jgi:hypothetical protein
VRQWGADEAGGGALSPVASLAAAAPPQLRGERWLVRPVCLLFNLFLSVEHVAGAAGGCGLSWWRWGSVACGGGSCEARDEARVRPGRKRTGRAAGEGPGSGCYERGTHLASAEDGGVGSAVSPGPFFPRLCPRILHGARKLVRCVGTLHILTQGPGGCAAQDTQAYALQLLSSEGGHVKATMVMAAWALEVR